MTGEQEPPPINIDQINEKQLLNGIKDLDAKKCQFCNAILDSDDETYIVNEKGKIMIACRKCYFNKVGTGKDS
ncbi:MAG: hypothetical protein ACTSWN_06950 [Promethearchaeota archaeon]